MDVDFNGRTLKSWKVFILHPCTLCPEPRCRWCPPIVKWNTVTDPFIVRNVQCNCSPLQWINTACPRRTLLSTLRSPALLSYRTSCVSSLGKQESESYSICRSRPGLTWGPSTAKRTGFRSLITISCDGAVPSRLSWTADGSNATFLTSFAEMKVIVGHLPVYTSHCWGPRRHLDKTKKTSCDLPL